MSRWLKWLFITLVVGVSPLLLGSGGCSGGGGLLDIDEPTEIAIGKQAAADVEAKNAIITGTPDAARVERIGKSIVALGNRPNLPWTFKVVDMKDVNAFALPGGFVYVTKGLLDLGVPDDELAGVLGHECSHVNQRHSVKAIQQAMTLSVVSEIALRKSSDVAQLAVAYALQYGVTLPHSRANEYEADALGVRLAYNAGYPADSMSRFLTRLDALPNSPNTAEWMSDHPATKARVERTQKMAVEVGALPRPVPLQLSDYDKRMIKNMPAEKK